VFGLADRGRIARGLRADLLLVDGDPCADITATSVPMATWPVPTNSARRPISPAKSARLVLVTPDGQAPISPPAGRCTAAGRCCTTGMVIGMATRKVTITLDEAQLDQIRSLVQAHAAPSVSGFVQHAVAVALDDVAGWGAMLAEALRQTGGALSEDERAWADDVLGTGTRPAA
jgi:hypothetical protein